MICEAVQVFPSINPLVAASVDKTGVARLIIFWEFRLTLLVGAVIWSSLLFKVVVMLEPVLPEPVTSPVRVTAVGTPLIPDVIEDSTKDLVVRSVAKIGVPEPVIL